MRKFHASWLIMLLTVWSGRALAELPWTPTEDEFRSLPQYCKVKMTQPESSPEWQQWHQTLGKDFLHVHHYCAGMNFAARSYRLPDEKDRIYFRKKAFTNFQYMFEHADATFSLMPDIYMSRGRLYMSGSDATLAMADFKKAAELRPDMASAYLAQADWLVKFKKPDQALVVVTEGLRHAPDSKSLQKRYVSLGGKPPYPEPVAKVPEKAPAAPAPSPEPAPAAAEGQRPGQPATATSQPEKAAEPEPAVEQPAEKIGNATNPWCRFCPELPANPKQAE